jgi:hypothetical protein
MKAIKGKKLETHYTLNFVDPVNHRFYAGPLTDIWEQVTCGQCKKSPSYKKVSGSED